MLTAEMFLHKRECKGGRVSSTKCTLLKMKSHVQLLMLEFVHRLDLMNTGFYSFCMNELSCDRFKNNH